MVSLNVSPHTLFVCFKTPLFRCDEKLNHNILYMSSKKCTFSNSLILMRFCCGNPVDEMWIKIRDVGHGVWVEGKQIFFPYACSEFPVRFSESCFNMTLNP
jgi:hypothetical protein